MKVIIKKIKLLWVKMVLYGTLLAFVAATLLWMLNTDSSLSENFFAGAVEIFVTVFLIDGLLSMDRRRRMRTVNKAQANSIQTITSIRILGLTGAFGFKYSNDIELTEYSNVQLRQFVSDFLVDQRYLKFLDDLKGMKRELMPILKKLDERIEMELTGIRKSLKEVKPYVNPDIIHQIDDFQPKIIAQLSIVNFMYAVIYEHLPSKGHKDPKKDGDFWPFFKDHVYEDLVVTGEGNPDKESLESAIGGMFNLLLDIHSKAESNQLHYDV